MSSNLNSWNVITELSLYNLYLQWYSEIFPLLFLEGGARHKMDSLSTANVEFCLDMFKELTSNHVGDNIFFSPLSLLYALSTLLLGARGKQCKADGKGMECSKDFPTAVESYMHPLWVTSVYQENCHLVKEETHMGKSYFLRVNNDLNNEIHYNVNHTIHVIHHPFLTIGGFTCPFLKFAFRVHPCSDLNMTENICVVLFLPSRTFT